MHEGRSKEYISYFEVKLIDCVCEINILLIVSFDFAKTDVT